MSLTVNDKVLSENNLTLEEFLVLYLCFKECDIQKTITTLIDKEFAYKDLKNPLSLVLSDNNKELITDILINSDRKIVNTEDSFNSLARKLREIYPEGKKPGTTYYWRDSSSVIAKKLKTLVVKFDFHFTEEEAIEATKKYVEEHKQDDRYMHLLKYFILKTDPTTGECKSEFMSIIENKDQKSVTENDWVNIK